MSRLELIAKNAQSVTRGARKNIGRYLGIGAFVASGLISGCPSPIDPPVEPPIIENTAPTVTLNGDGRFRIEAGVDEYVELGATAYDKEDGDLGVTISGGVNSKVPGPYIVTYTSEADSEGLTGEAERVVLAQDTLPPALVTTMIGDKPIQAGEYYVAMPIKAVDIVDGEIYPVFNSGEEVNTDVIGDYEVKYEATDNAGNTSEPFTKVIKVIDTKAPVISTENESEISIPFRGQYTEEIPTDQDFPTAQDSFEGSLPVNVYGDTVDTEVPGVYSRHFSATDSSGNMAELERLVTVENPIIPGEELSIEDLQDRADDSFYHVEIPSGEGNQLLDAINNRTSDFPEDETVIFHLADGIHDFDGSQPALPSNTYLVGNGQSVVDGCTIDTGFMAPDYGARIEGELRTTKNANNIGVYNSVISPLNEGSGFLSTQPMFFYGCNDAIVSENVFSGKRIDGSYASIDAFLGIRNDFEEVLVRNNIFAYGNYGDQGRGMGMAVLLNKSTGDSSLRLMGNTFACCGDGIYVRLDNSGNGSAVNMGDSNNTGKNAFVENAYANVSFYSELENLESGPEMRGNYFEQSLGMPWGSPISPEMFDLTSQREPLLTQEEIEDSNIEFLGSYDNISNTVCPYLDGALTYHPKIDRD